MPVVLETSNDTFEELPVGFTITIGEVNHPWQIVETWNNQQLAEIGVYRVIPPTVPEGKQEVSHTIERIDGVVTYVPVYEDTVPLAVESISDRQFFQQLAVQDIITEDEALAAVQVGAIPAALEALVDQLPEEQQFPARMLITGGTVFERYHPLTIAIGTAFGWTTEQIDTFFHDAFAL